MNTTPAPTEDLLIIDDDEPFRLRLARAMEKRSHEVTAHVYAALPLGRKSG